MMPSPPGSTARALASRSRLRILRALRASDSPEEWSIGRVAEEMELHPNTAREHLQVLESAGFVTSRAVPTGGRGRPPLVYRACERTAGETWDEHLRARMLDLLLEAYEQNADAARTGDGAPPTPGLAQRPEAARQVAQLELHFEELGFDPEVTEPPLDMHFTRCPMMTLARSETELVCGVHADLARAVLERQPGPVEVDELHPFVGHSHCILHLRDRDAPGAQA